MAKISTIDYLIIKKRTTAGTEHLRQRVFALAAEGETIRSLIERSVDRGLGSPKQVRAAIYGLIERSDEKYAYLRGTET